MRFYYRGPQIWLHVRITWELKTKQNKTNSEAQSHPVLGKSTSGGGSQASALFKRLCCAAKFGNLCHHHHHFLTSPFGCLAFVPLGVCRHLPGCKSLLQDELGSSTWQIEQETGHRLPSVQSMAPQSPVAHKLGGCLCTSSFQ